MPDRKSLSPFIPVALDFGSSASCAEMRRRILVPIAIWIALAIAASLVACTASTHATRSGDLGRSSTLERMEAVASVPGPVAFERVVAADWVVPLSGLLNLDDPRAKAAGLEDRSEPIEIYLYVLQHPRAGDFIVDSGVAAAFAEPGADTGASALVEMAMQLDQLDVHLTTKAWLATRPRPLAGVFLTHIHLDHVMGLPDVPADVPVYAGPGETDDSAFLNLFTRGTIDRMLEGAGPIREWPFEAASDAAGLKVVDVLGDESIWAIHAPGHTPGTTAYLVRATDGPRLLVGDVSHTRWGWENGVEPGSFTADHSMNAASLAWLRSFVERHPSIEVHIGHQRLGGPTS